MLKAVELSDVTKLPPSAQNLQLLACQHSSPSEAKSRASPLNCLDCLCPGKARSKRKRRSAEVTIHLADHQNQLHSVLLPATSSPRTAKVSSSPASKHGGGFDCVVPQKPPWPEPWLEANSVPRTLRDELQAGRAKSITVHSSFVPPEGAEEAKVVSAHWSDLSPGWLLLAAKSIRKGAPAGSAPKWRWQALHISPEMDAVSTSPHESLHNEESEEGAVMSSVLMHHNPTGGQLAVGVAGPPLKSCIMTLNRDLDLMWHAPWQRFHSDGSLCSVAWLYDTEYVAAVDNTGQMRVFHEWGGMALLELPEHVAKPGIAQPSRPHIQCNKLLGDQDAYPGQLQQLMQNKQPRPQAAYQLCTPAGASYSSLTSTWMACLDGAAPAIPFLAQPTAPTLPAAQRYTRNLGKNSRNKQGSNMSSSRELLLLVISNCQVVLALTFHLSGTPPSPPPSSHPSKPHGAHPPSYGPHDQQNGTEQNGSAHHPPHDAENGDADVASFTRSSLNPLYSKRCPGDDPQLTQEQQQEQQQQRKPKQQGSGDSHTKGSHQAAPVDLNSADVGGVNPEEKEALLLGLPEVPLGSSLLAYAASKRQQQQQQQQQQQGHVQQQGITPASIQWHQLADHWHHLCASLPESTVPQSEPAIPPTPPFPVGSPTESTKAASPDSDVFVMDESVVEALLAGDAALLNGRPLQGLRHYVRAHIFGFLPSLLVLLHCGQLGPSLHLLSKFASMVAKHSTQGSLSTPKATMQAQQQHSTQGLDLEDSGMAPYGELAAEWEAQARTCMQPFLEGDECAQASTSHGSGDARQLMHAAKQQLSVACQCLAYISCALHEQQQVQARGKRGGGSVPVASRHPPHASTGVISLPTPIVWHPLQPVHSTTSTPNIAAPAAAEATGLPGDAQSTHVCCFKIFHTAFDVRLLQRGLERDPTISSVSAVPSASAPSASGIAAAAPQSDQSQQNTAAAAAAASVAAAFSDPRYAVGLLAVTHACEVEVQKHLMLQSHPHAHPSKPAPLIAARVNWGLLHRYPSAARAAAVWREVGNWRKAVVLAFSVHRLMQQQPHTELGALASDSGLQIGWAILEAQMASDMLAGLEVDAACQTLLELLQIPHHLLGPASPLYTQLLREVCQRLASLLPKRLCISPLSPLPSTCNSTSSKDGDSLASLLDLSHGGICCELHAHLAAAAAAVLQAACEAHCHGVSSNHADSDSKGGKKVVATVLQSLFEDEEVEACLKMLLQWRGVSLDGQALQAAIQQVCTCAQRACDDDDGAGDGDDLQPLQVLPVLQHALIQAPPLLPEDDAHAVLLRMQALLDSRAAGRFLPGDGKEKGAWGSECKEGEATSGVSGSGRQRRRMGAEDAMPQNGKVPVLPPIEHNQGVAKNQAVQEQERRTEGLPVRDVGELSMLVDCARVMAALLACLCQLLPASLPQNQALIKRAACEAVGNNRSSSNMLGEQQQEEGAEAAANAGQAESDPCRIDSALPGHLATLLSVDWALVTRSHVAALLHTLLTQRGSEGARPAHSPAAQVQALEVMLLHWTVALVEGAAFHPQAELQALVHGVLSAVHGKALPSARVASVDKALRQRRVLNARLAEEVARLKKAAAAQETSSSDAAARAESAHAPDGEELVIVGCGTVVTPAHLQEQWQQAVGSALLQLARGVGDEHKRPDVGTPTVPGGDPTDASTSVAAAPAAAPIGALAAADSREMDGPLATARAANSRGSLLLCVLSSMVGRPWLSTHTSRNSPEALSEELGSCFANPLLPIPLTAPANAPSSLPDKGPIPGTHTLTESLTPRQQLEGLMCMGKWAYMGANDAGAAAWERAVAAAYDAWMGAPAAEVLAQSDSDTVSRGLGTLRSADTVQEIEPDQESKGAQETEADDEGVTIVGGPGAPPVTPSTGARQAVARQQQQQQQHRVSRSGVGARTSTEGEFKVDEMSAAKLADFWWNEEEDKDKEGDNQEEGGAEAAVLGGAVPGGSAPRSAVPRAAVPGKALQQQQEGALPEREIQQHQGSGEHDGLEGIVQEDGAIQTSREVEHEQDSAAGVAAAASGGGGGIMTPSTSFSSASVGVLEAGIVAGSSRKVLGAHGTEQETKDAGAHAQGKSISFKDMGGHAQGLDREQHDLGQQQQQQQSQWQQQQQLELDAAFARDGQRGLANACARAMGYTWPHVQEGRDAEGAAGATHPEQGSGPAEGMGAAAIAKALGYGKDNAQAQGPLLDNGQDSAVASEYAQRTGAGRVEAFLYSVGISPAGSRAGSLYPPSPALTSPASTSRPGYPTVFSNSIPAPAHHTPAQSTPSTHAHSTLSPSEPTSRSHHTPPSSHTTQPSPAASAHPQHTNVPSPVGGHHTPARSVTPEGTVAEEEKHAVEGAHDPGCLAIPTTLNHLDRPLNSAPHSPSLQSPHSSDNEAEVGPRHQAARRPSTHKHSHSTSLPHDTPQYRASSPHEVPNGAASVEHPSTTAQPRSSSLHERPRSAGATESSTTTTAPPPALPKSNSGRMQHQSVLVAHPHPHMRTALSISCPESPPTSNTWAPSSSRDHTNSRVDEEGHPWGHMASDTRDILTGRTSALAPSQHHTSPSGTALTGSGTASNVRKPHSLLEQSLGEMLWRGGGTSEAAPQLVLTNGPAAPQGAHKGGMLASSIGNTLGVGPARMPDAADARASVTANGVHHVGNDGIGDGHSKEPINVRQFGNDGIGGGRAREPIIVHQFGDGGHGVGLGKGPNGALASGVNDMLLGKQSRGAGADAHTAAAAGAVPSGAGVTPPAVGRLASSIGLSLGPKQQQQQQQQAGRRDELAGLGNGVEVMENVLYDEERERRSRTNPCVFQNDVFEAESEFQSGSHAFKQHIEPQARSTGGSFSSSASGNPLFDPNSQFVGAKHAVY